MDRQDFFRIDARTSLSRASPEGGAAEEADSTAAAEAAAARDSSFCLTWSASLPDSADCDSMSDSTVSRWDRSDAFCFSLASFV